LIRKIDRWSLSKHRVSQERASRFSKISANKV
jgi:hypothetical protein